MHVCICKFMWHRIDLSPRGMTIKFHSFIHSFIHGYHQYVVRACVCLCVYIAVGMFLHMCMYVYVCVYVAAGRFCMCVRVCLCVWSRLHGTHTCVVFCGEKKLVNWEGEWGGAQLRMKEESGTGLRRCGIHLN